MIRQAWAGMALLVLAGACGSGGGGGGGGGLNMGGSGGSATSQAGTGGGTPIDNTARDAEIQRFSEAACALEKRCYPGFFSWNSTSDALCLQRTNDFNVWLADLPDTKQGAAEFKRCADFYTKATCEDFLAPTPPADCTFPGSRADGEPCNAPDQCASLHCTQTGYSCGQCAPMPKPGVSCTSQNDCVVGEWCMPSGKCAVGANDGESCSDQLWCRYGFNCTNGTCTKPPGTVGATCSKDAPCDWMIDLACSADSKCVKATAVQPGGACAFPQYCAGHGKCTDGKCVAGPADKGGACDDKLGPACLWPAACVSGACQYPDASLECR